jgi:hypothetical protein
MKRHDVDAVSLAFGTAFLAVVGWWLMVRTIDLTLPPVGWFAAGGLIAAGLVGLFLALRPHQTGEPTRYGPVGSP